MDQTTLLFLILSGFTGISAVAVVVTQNIVRAAVYLLFTLGGTAGIFFLLGADFVGATQLIIYVGGILVLVVFGVMLTAQGPFISMKVGAGEWFVASVVGLLLLGALTVTIMQTGWTRQVPATDMTNAQSSMSSARLGEAFLGVRQIVPQADLTGFENASRRRRVGYLLPFEIVSVHLLVVLIGAAYLARAKRRKGGRG
jgi:NADH:ubiquinone oxidoreductase subunit 6 (subunit J)